ncbi:hypothetical protein [Streptomyces avermitilis]|uniref:hypothetical protein n=1 Tax=Streptomyces avermitilis TaxID=33903 RepID=UPI0036AD01AD
MADRAAGLVLFLEHCDAPAGVGQQVRRDEPVGAGPDHYRVRHGRLPFRSIDVTIARAEV